MPTDWNKRLAPFYVPLIADILDEIGITKNVLRHEIEPIYAEAKVAGVAYPARMRKLPKFPEYSPVGEDWADLLVEMLESVGEGQVFVVETGDCVEAATWGELMSNAVKTRGALGAISDGAVRDVPKILEIQPPFPVWGRGFNPTDSKGRIGVTEFGDITVKCGGVTVRPGDIVFGDLDGVVVIPQEKAEEVVSEAEERFEKEKGFRQEVRDGVPVSKALAKYKVL